MSSSLLSKNVWWQVARRASVATSISVSLLAAGCGGGSSGEPTTHDLGGSISGLSGSGLVIANGSDTLTVSPGATTFTMPTAVGAGSSYALSVSTQPGGQMCSFANASGTMPGADLRNAVLTCAANSYTLGGSVSGLTGTGLVLANGTDELAVAANATTFTMGNAVAQGSSYAVTVMTQPSGQSCGVTNASGQMGGANVTDVQFTCAAPSFTLGGTISGLNVSGLVLANGTDELTVAANATTFTMGNTLADGATYAVTVRTQPAGRTCTVASGAGSVTAANVGNVAVTCVINAVNSYTLGGTISGLTGPGLVLANGADELTVAANATTFTMNAAVADGASYEVTVMTQPPGHLCAVADGMGTMTGNVADVAVTCAHQSTVSTLAGSSPGYADGTGTAAAFDGPQGIAVDSQGNVYVADTYNHKIRKITPAGVVSTLAGSSQGYADGTGAAAQFNSPWGLSVDSQGNVFVADTSNHRIRKITPAGDVSTLAGGSQGYADGAGAAASFSTPTGVGVDAQGNVYVADNWNDKIRKVTPAGDVSTLAGSTSGYADGTGTAAKFTLPQGVSVDAAGNVYVADSWNNRIRKITPAGEVTTVAGSSSGFADGTGAAARFWSPQSVSVDAQGNIFVADYGNQKIRVITPGGEVTTLAGSNSGFADGAATSAQFTYPTGVAVDAQGNVYVADTQNHKIRKIVP